MKTKRLIFSSFIYLAVLTAVGCSKESVPDSRNQGGFSIEARISEDPFPGETRTGLSIEGERAYLYFNGGDRIRVNECLGTCVVTREDSKKGWFTFASQIESATLYRCMLPADMMDENGNCNLPSTLTYVKGNSFSGVCPLYCETESINGTFSLDAVTGFLQIALKGNYTVTSIKVEAGSGDKMSGPFTVSDKTAAFTAGTGHTNSITLDCSQSGGVELGGRKMYFYIPVFAGTYEKFTVTVGKNDGSSDVYNSDSGEQIDIERLKIYYLPCGEGVDTETDLSIEATAEAKSHSTVLVSGSISGDYVPSVVTISYNDKYGADKKVSCTCFDGKFRKLISVLNADTEYEFEVEAAYKKKSGIKSKASFFVSQRTPVKPALPSGAVDLGLSVYWADANVYETSEGQKVGGDYYAWGATSLLYSGFEFGESDVTIQFNNTNWPADYPYFQAVRSGVDYSTLSTGYIASAYSKYNVFEVSNPADGIMDLEPADDIANQKKGNGWRTPTREEFEELIGKCATLKVAYRTYGGTEWQVASSQSEIREADVMKGILFENNGKSIILPALNMVSMTSGSSFGSFRSMPRIDFNYWSQSLDFDTNRPFFVDMNLLATKDDHISSENLRSNLKVSSGSSEIECQRFFGCPVRPVF